MLRALDGQLKHVEWAGLQWIWAPGDGAGQGAAPAPVQACFQQVVELGAHPVRAWIQVWSESGYAFWINGISAYESPRGGLWTHRDEVDHLLRPGTNTLAIEFYGTPRGTPGLLVAGEIELQDGSCVPLRSDSTWRSRATPTEGWHLAVEALPWPRAVAVFDAIGGDRRAASDDGSFDPDVFATQVASFYGVADAQALHVPTERYVAFQGGGYWSPLERLADGSIATVLRAGGCHTGRDGRLYYIRSRDGGRTWSSPVVVADSPWNDYAAALGALRDGTLIVGYRKLRNYDGRGNTLPRNDFPPFAETMIVRSEDDGLTWTEPRVISGLGAAANAPCSKMLEYPDGSVWMIEYRSNGGPADSTPFYRRTSDRGRTWDAPRPITTSLSAGTTSVARLRDGRLVAALRGFAAPGEAIFMSTSDDGGDTWTVPGRVTEPGEFPADVIELRSGRLLLTVGRRMFPGGVQILFSDDRGQTWYRPHRFILTSDAVHDHGWPSSVQLEDGTIVTTAYATGNRRHLEVGVHMGVIRWRESE